ncbi:hypothetical protein AB0F71_24545 [Kitasatospora sp. NPDC028055]|uniref:hypothetical protein n=1 Tax=Kitasatospora sp. NPDC028055 TaxID=3155653 RepID=UPI0033D6CF4B
MNNLDFSNEPGFSWYVVLLALSGTIMLVLGVLPLRGLKVGMRILNIAIGLAFAGYAYYLAFVFEGGTYRIFFQALILPIAMIVTTVKAVVERSNAKNAPQQPVTPYTPHAPYNPNAPQAPYNPNAAAPQAAAFNPNAPQAGQPGQPVAPQGAVPNQPSAPAQPVADNPYAQPQPPQQPAG